MSIAGFDHCAITVRDIQRTIDFYLRWDAPLEAAIELLGRRGVEIEEGPVRRPAADGQVGRSVYFRDPDGNLLELLSTRTD